MSQRTKTMSKAPKKAETLRVLFRESLCGSQNFRKGRTYDVPAAEAREYVKKGIAVKDTAPAAAQQTDYLGRRTDL